jgi:hypothetical protein
VVGSPKPRGPLNWLGQNQPKSGRFYEDISAVRGLGDLFSKMVF